ncbi:MAG: hypothetical protein Q7U04_18120 [Bacteriovorax sp.]|nr:hypothetical protein [Bacteriovorax sp.]
MKFIFISLLIIFSFQASAKNKVQTLLEEKTNISPYQVLAQFHESADGQPVRFEEFNNYDVDNDYLNTKFQNCIRVANDNENIISHTAFYSFNKLKRIPGTPANGPLFPGTPEQTIPRYSLALTERNVRYTDADALSDILDNSSWLLTLQSGTIFTGTSDYVLRYDNVGYNYAEIKKHGNLLSFFAAKRKAGVQTNSTYGYCWNE